MKLPESYPFQGLSVILRGEGLSGGVKGDPKYYHQRRDNDIPPKTTVLS
jgi:hypothetical protein